MHNFPSLEAEDVQVGRKKVVMSKDVSRQTKKGGNADKPKRVPAYLQMQLQLQSQSQSHVVDHFYLRYIGIDSQ